MFHSLTTPHVADACLRRGVEIRCAPHDLQAINPEGCVIAGRILPARHAGSVDVFLEIIESARPGDVLVVDNGGRTDEACVGDLIAWEAKHAQLAGIIIWGLHRDTPEILAIDVPLFSQGTTPTGPIAVRERHPEAMRSARVGAWTVTADDIVLGDENGVLFIPLSRAVELATAARKIRDTEHAQAKAMTAGTSLRSQLRFAEFLAERAHDPSLTFRKHLRKIGGAVEE